MKRVAALLALLLAACGQTPQTSQDLRIAISPAAQPASTALLACLPRDESVAITIDGVYPAAVDLADYDFYIRLGEPDAAPAFAAQLATERVVMIVNHAQDISVLTSTQAGALFSGRAESWEEVGGEDEPVELWVGPDSDEARVGFEASVLRGTLAGSAHITSDAELVAAEVAADSSAAGIVPAATVTDSVQAIDLGLQLPLLAVAAADPQGTARDLLACMQSGAGQQVLAESYIGLEE